MNKPKGEYTPLKKGETGSIQLLYGCLQIMDECHETLKKRMQETGTWRKFRVIETWMNGIVQAMMGTIDPKKRNIFMANLSNQELRVVNKHSINTTPFQTVVRSDDLLWLVKDGLSNHCAVCMGCTDDYKKCEYRQHIKHMTMFEMDESGGVCMGKQIEKSNEW